MSTSNNGSTQSSSVTRLLLLVIVLALLGGCVSEGPVFSNTEAHDPIPGEATPAPQSGPHGGWAW